MVNTSIRHGCTLIRRHNPKMTNENELLLLSVGADLDRDEFAKLSEELNRTLGDIGIDQPIVLVNQPIETIDSEELVDELSEQTHY